MELIHDQLAFCTVENNSLYLPVVHIFFFFSFLPDALSLLLTLCSQLLLHLDLTSMPVDNILENL